MHRQRTGHRWHSDHFQPPPCTWYKLYTLNCLVLVSATVLGGPLKVRRSEVQASVALVWDLVSEELVTVWACL